MPVKRSPTPVSDGTGVNEKGRKNRAAKRRHPLLRARPKGVWYPDLVDVVYGYPKTQEAWQKRSDLMRQQVKLYNAEGITFRSGVPDGWAGKKTLIKQIKDASDREAVELVEDLIVTKRFIPDNAESQLILQEALGIIVAEKHTPEQAPVPLYNVKDRLTAMKMAWDVVQRKPVSTSLVAETSAEDFLKALATQD